MRHYSLILFLILLLVIPWFAINYPGKIEQILSEISNIENQVADVFLAHNPKTIMQIKSRYDSANISRPLIPVKKVRVLLVPGHEPGYGGAEYGSLKEREMTVELAQDLRQFLQANSRYEVFMTRDNSSWNLIFDNYFKSQWDAITAWVQAHKDEVTHMTRLGLYHPVISPVIHNSAPTDIATRLFGISKWANENDIDIVIHVHFNDYPGHGQKNPGTYSGFTIYVPQKQYSNSTTTQALADTVFKRLSKYNPVSDLSGESGGVVPDPDLIAVGAFNSVNAASMLIEYGYIYEPQFTDDSLHAATIKDLAFQTYLGLQDFFDKRNAVSMSGSSDTLIMPKSWTNPITEKDDSPQIFALQTALLLDGDYPPQNKTMNDCPRTGSLGPCTKAALDLFQRKYGVTGEKGIAGSKTLQELNRMYTDQSQRVNLMSN